MIHGKLIDIVPLSLVHSSFMTRLLNNQEIAYLEGRTEPMVSIERQNSWFQNSIASSNQYFIIQTKEEALPVGYMSLKIDNPISRNAQLAIKMAPEGQKKGYGTDAVKTIMKHSFYTFNLHRLYTHILIYNKGSQNLFISKCGWRIEGTELKSIYTRGEYHDRYMLAILKDEFTEKEKDKFYNPFTKSDH